jgi:hypothetical protein
MAVNVCLPLIGDPSHELEAEPKARELRQLGEQLRERLAKAADTLDKLQAAGWHAQIAMFDILLVRNDVQTREQAERLLQEVGIDPNELMIVEEVEEDEAD